MKESESQRVETQVFATAIDMYLDGVNSASVNVNNPYKIIQFSFGENCHLLFVVT